MGRSSAKWAGHVREVSLCNHDANVCYWCRMATSVLGQCLVTTILSLLLGNVSLPGSQL